MEKLNKEYATILAESLLHDDEAANECFKKIKLILASLNDVLSIVNSCSRHIEISEENTDSIKEAVIIGATVDLIQYMSNNINEHGGLKDFVLLFKCLEEVVRR